MPGLKLARLSKKATRPSKDDSDDELEIIPQLPHINDGLIFTCRETAYVAGTDQHILKWKPPHENTIDFRLQLGSFPMEEDDEGPYEDFDQKPEFELLVFHGNDGYRKFADLFLTNEEWEELNERQKPRSNYVWQMTSFIMSLIKRPLHEFGKS